jgi:hypothetical protein
MTDLDSRVLATLRDCWIGEPFRIRDSYLARELQSTVPEVRAALARLIGAGDIAIFSGPDGAHVRVKHPPRWPPRRHPSFKPILAQP